MMIDKGHMKAFSGPHEDEHEAPPLNITSLIVQNTCQGDFPASLRTFDLLVFLELDLPAFAEFAGEYLQAHSPEPSHMGAKQSRKQDMNHARQATIKAGAKQLRQAALTEANN